MIELERHIEILLLNNDCVIVPGIGGFMAYHVEARYDESDHTFLPPMRALGFNPQLTSLNDSLLAQSYVEAYDISYPEATRRIEAEVKEVKQALDTQRSYELHNIGTLYINESGKMEFAPCEAGILSPSLYGLNTLEMEKLSVATAELKPTEAAPKPRTMTLQPQAQGATTAIEPAVDPTIHIKVSWLRNFSAAAAAVVAFLCLSVPVKNSNPNLNISKSPNETMIELVSTAQSLAQKHVQETDQKSDAQPAFEEVTLDSETATPNTGTAAPAKEATTPAKEATAPAKVATTPAKVATTPAKEATTPTKETAATAKPATETTAAQETASSRPYYIVLASRVSKVNAGYFIDKLHKKGLDKAALYTHNNINRVVYGNYATETEAQNAIREMRDHEEFEQAWVYHEK